MGVLRYDVSKSWRSDSVRTLTEEVVRDCYELCGSKLRGLLIISLTQFDRDAGRTISCGSKNRFLVTAELAARSCLWWYILA
ncbi:hypothetical protein P5673_007441 [Acropora cervicornis]|uniref:Uncharacterized protein n=1 Tax=Acropora cervicornis TaxID=6130 RepID=A0AAD9VBK3_ACRCE|nr:hypothetical protein P5673_007441 [Acropora cervicornis]